LHEELNEDLTIVSSGSEVSIALEAASKLKAQGIKTRVISLPCWRVFDQQPEEYRLSVFRSGAPILSLEALSVRKPLVCERAVTPESDLRFRAPSRLRAGRSTATSSTVFPPGVPPARTSRFTRSSVSLAPVRVAGHR